MTFIPPMPKTWSEQKPFVGNVNKLGANNLMAEILSRGTHGSFQFVLGCILEKLIEENHVIAFEENCTVPRLAWATRNVMELRVLCRYVCKSEDNLKRFQNDILTTGATALQSVIRLCNDWAKELGATLVPPKIHRNHSEIQAAREVVGLGSESALLAKTCAKQVGLEKELFALSGATSMLVHPSALSVLKTFDPESCRDTLTVLGVKLVSDVILDAREHIKVHGYKPAHG